MAHRHRFISIALLLALFVVAAPSARTTPVYIDLGQDSLLCTPGQTVPIDIDANGAVDFVMYCRSFSGGTFMHVNVPTLLLLTNKVAVNGTLNAMGDDQARPCGLSELISASLTFKGMLSLNGPLIAQPSFAGSDIFEGRGEQYIGVCFNRNGAIHYGWIRVSVNAAGDTARISATAYENLPGVGIITGNGDPAPVAVQQITVHGSAGVGTIVTAGGTLQMVADVLPADATNKSVEWSVSNTATATIDAGGLLQAHADGMVTVTATAADGSGISGSTMVTISNQAQVVQVTGITVRSLDGQTTISMPGGTLAMTAEVMPANATNKAVTWSVDNSAVAMIDAGGVIHAYGDGTVTVRATAADGSGVSGSTVVTVTGQSPVVVQVTKITVRSLTGDTAIGTAGGTLAMTADIEPANATIRNVMWSVDNGAAATVDMYGMVTATGNGRAVVTATAMDGSNVSGSTTISISGQAVAAVADLAGTGGAAPQMTMRGDLLTIQLPDNAEPVAVSIYDVVGRSVAQHTSDGTGRLMLIDCSALPAGMYLVAARSAGATFGDRMVLAR